jgi:hypothetical protein
MLVVADVPVEDRRHPVSNEDKALFGIDRLNTMRSEIPAMTHIQMPARIQTVHKETNPRYDALLSACKARTGCPVLVNTSFNIPKRTDCLYSGGGIPLFHGNRHRTASYRRLHRPQGRPRCFAACRLKEHFRT